MSQAPAILVVDDEEQILRVLRPTLEAQDYRVVTVTTGEAALQALTAERFSVMVLDLGLPDMDGKEVIRRARLWTSVPIIVLSARDADTEKIAALDDGAEDYLAKPFSVGELLARIRVALRNGETAPEAQTFTVEGMEFDFRRRRAKLTRGEVSLSGRETQFLRLLLERRGQVVTHREIIMAVWGDLDRADAQFVRVLAGQVRHKVEENPSDPRLILTVPGVGYQLGPTAPEPEPVPEPT
jgi:two-component system KDP operon response regulator KdpE